MTLVMQKVIAAGYLLTAILESFPITVKFATSRKRFLVKARDT
jgi:hypothetical protein